MQQVATVATTDLTFHIDGQLVTIPVNRVWYFKSFGNYIKIITDSKTLITKQTTNEMEHLLPTDTFIRIHKSFIINMTKIQCVGENEIVMINQIKIPIGKTFKRYVKKNLES
jgi:DNA-binding LytR/AlgR family response regulator